MTLSNYPPGVTGNEIEIAGADWENETDKECPKCGEPGLWMQGYRGMQWESCGACDYVGDKEPIDVDEEDYRNG